MSVRSNWKKTETEPIISRRTLRRIVMSLAVVVVFVTTYVLILPAVTLDKNEAGNMAGTDAAVTEESGSGDGPAASDPGSDTDPEEAGAGAADNDASTASDKETGSDPGDGSEMAPGETSEDTSAETPGTVDQSVMGDYVRVFEEKTELTFDGKGYKVIAEVGTDAKLPVDTKLKVKEIKEGTKDENGEEYDYDAYCEEALGAVRDKDGKEGRMQERSVRLYDISFESASYDGQGDLEPAAPVKVRILFDKAVETSETVKTRAVHFGYDEKNDRVLIDVLKTEIGKDRNKAMKEASFKSDSFSVYGVVYTVDFHYDVAGEKYDFSIPGGGFISFTELVKVLGAVEDTNGDAAEEFVSDVADVEFSNPELLSVSKVEQDTTVGAIRKRLDLECEYSSDLTEEQIAEINARAVKAGDWALISKRPFTSEETLTVTMNNGDRWTVNVTDAVPGAFPQQVDIEIAGDGSITLSEYVERYDWDWMGDYAYEERQTFYSGRTVDLSVRYGSNLNNQSITANAAPGYVFDHWEKNGTPLSGGDLESEVIPAGALNFNPHDSLTAVFRPEPESSGGENYTDFNELTEAWKEKITNSKPDVDKTAAVYDYENRIYKVDITASSKLYGMIEDLDLAFVTDVSGSMHFPSKLESAAVFDNEQGMLAQLDSLCRQRHGGTLPSYTGPDEIYYLIMDPQNSSNVYAVRRYNNLWYAFPAGVTDLSPIYAPVLDPNNRYWSRLDSCFDSGGNVLAPFTTPANQIVEKNVYLATDTTQRLEYLREALRLTQSVLYKMDPDAKIGVTTFAGTANRGRLYNNTAQDQNALQNFITNIAVAGGTRQDLGLIEGKALLDTDTSDVKKTVVLITDGAPNGTTWGQIQYQANIIKNAGIDIYTVGLSLENVTGASEGLYNTSSNSIDEQHGFAFDARDGRGLVEAVKSILESLTVHATMVGSVTDTIDPAFYPVDKDGNPLSPGVEYEDENGHAYTLSKQGDAWTVTWSDQNIEWAQEGASGAQVPGWKGTVYVKAKENFLGGNAIKTNSGTDADSIVLTGYKTVIDTDDNDEPIYSDTHALKNEDGTPKTVSETLSTPYVNVDELALTSNDTEWTVYLGTEVDPKDQLERLLKNILIRKVVSGDTDEMITDKDQMLGGTGESSKTMKLTDYLGLDSDSEISALADELCTSGSRSFPYNDPMASVYGHGHVGDIVISLTETEGCFDKGNHATEAVGTDARFTLKVEYRPGTNAERNSELGITGDDYHTTPGGSPGESVPKTGNDMTSSNSHIINVFEKGFRITKTDEGLDDELAGAEFDLYLTDSACTTVEQVRANAKDGYPVALTKTGGVYFTKESVARPEAGQHYYVVEKKAPAGYVLPDRPIEVTLNITDSYTTVPGGEEAQSVPAAGPYNWTETAAVQLLVPTGSMIVDADGNAISGITADSENGMSYYKVANNPGVELPSAGGPGTTWMYIFGMLLTLAGGMTFAVRRRMRA